MLAVVNADGTTSNGSLIDEIVREGARRMLAAALEAEVNSYLAEPADARDADGRRLVVRDGFHGERTIATSAGPVQVKAPRVNDKRVDAETGERKRFSSAILPPWARKTPKISEVLPLLYLHGLSTGDFVPALEQFLGSSAGLSSATVSRLTSQWADDHKVFQKRDLSATDFVYVWADGVHLKVRLDQAIKAIKTFERQYGTKFPKAVKKIVDDMDVLLAFYDHPAEHWIHLRTTNPIESTFATVRLRTGVTRGAGSRAAALAMMFKLIESAQQRWRSVNAPHLRGVIPRTRRRRLRRPRSMASSSVIQNLSSTL